MEEKHCDTETMRRENRRVAAMSWGAGDENSAPPIQTRGQMMGKEVFFKLVGVVLMLFIFFLDSSSSLLSLGGDGNVQPVTSPQTYIIAQNPAVLAHLMRENEKRGVNPSSYNTPASVFNSVAVDFNSKNPVTDPSLASNEPTSTATAIPSENLDDLSLKTVPIPANELLKLNKTIDGVPILEGDAVSLMSEAESTASTETLDRYKNPQDALQVPQERPPPPEYPPPCEIINAQTQQTHSIDPMYKALQKNGAASGVAMSNQTGQYDMANQQIPPQVFMPPPSAHSGYGYTQQQQPNYPQHLPPQSPQQTQQSPGDQKSRSLERNASQQSIVQAYAARLNSLERTKQADLGVKVSRSNSLNRQLGCPPEVPIRSVSLERSIPPPYGSKNSSLERKQQNVGGYNPPQHMPPQQGRGGSLERNQSQAIVDAMNRGFRGGSLERNPNGTGYILVNRSGSLERSMPYGPYRSPQPKKEEPVQEEIYDFGGANVKSCAAIQMKKSMEMGMMHPNMVPQSPLPTHAHHPPLSPQPELHHSSLPPNYSYQQAMQNQRIWGQSPPSSTQRLCQPFPYQNTSSLSPQQQMQQKIFEQGAALQVPLDLRLSARLL